MDETNTHAGGWADTHIHLLPDLDDGPANPETALALAEAAIADGTTHAVATPHANYQFTYDPERAQALCQWMQAQLGGRLQVAAGCELHLNYENVQAALANPRLYSLNGSRYLLCEFPEFFERGAMRTVLEGFRGVGLVPVLAHPERNPVFQQHPDALLDYLRLGCLSQVTASSFSGRFGQKAQRFAAEMLERDWIHVVASDGHSTEQRPPRLSRAHAFVTRERDAGTAQALCRDNPLAIILDRDLAYAPELPAKKKGLFARLRLSTPARQPGWGPR